MGRPGGTYWEGAPGAVMGSAQCASISAANRWWGLGMVLGLSFPTWKPST